MANKYPVFIFLVLQALFLTSCMPFGSKTGLTFEPHPLPQIEEAIPENVSFEFLNRNVLTPHCISCHAGMGDEKKLNWWLVPGVAEESELFIWMEDGSMPPKRPATTRELEIVRRYIEQMKTNDE